MADTNNNQIRKITSGGTVSLFAGSSSGYSGSTDATGSSARFSGPQGVEVDSRVQVPEARSGRDHAELDRACGLQLALGFRRRDPLLDQRIAKPLPLRASQGEQSHRNSSDGTPADQQRASRIEQYAAAAECQPAGDRNGQEDDRESEAIGFP